jgi:hypothetical protein
MMNRRSFFKFLPVAPVVMIAEGARAATADQAPPNKFIPTLQLIAYHKPVHQPGWFSNPVPDMNRAVSMSVGEDGKLWVRSKNKEWRRVVTE